MTVILVLTRVPNIVSPARNRAFGLSAFSGSVIWCSTVKGTVFIVADQFRIRKLQ
jgi:hypothetical protein